MKNLEDQLSSLNEGLEAYNRSQEREHEAEVYETRRQEVRDLRQRLQVSVARLLMIQKATTETVQRPDTARATKWLATVADAFAKSPESITKGRDYNSLKKALGKLNPGLL